jgi:phosphotransferase system  glucose/maltose/N-acetylglucosamine-specific IIC component
MKNKKRVRKGKVFLIVVSVVMLIALILSFPQAADKAGEIVGVAGDRIKDVARTVLAICVAVFLVLVGVSSLSYPFVGVTLIVVGLAIMAYSLWPYFKKGDRVSE